MSEMLTSSSTKPNRREGDEAYSKVIVVITDRIRIVECRDGIQWILQKRVSAKTATKAQWRGLKYHRSREDLITGLVRLKLHLTPEQLAVLRTLPEWIG